MIINIEAIFRPTESVGCDSFWGGPDGLPGTEMGQ